MRAAVFAPLRELFAVLALTGVGRDGGVGVVLTPEIAVDAGNDVARVLVGLGDGAVRVTGGGATLSAGRALSHTMHLLSESSLFVEHIGQTQDIFSSSNGR